MASRTPPIDPRIAAAPQQAPGAGGETDVRPMVALPRRGASGAMIAVGMILAAIILFVILDSRRRSQAEPAVKVSAADARPIGSSAPPPLYIPQSTPPAVLVPAAVAVTAEPPRQPTTVYVPRPEAPAPQPVQYYTPPQPEPMMQPPPQRVSNSPSVVIDTTTPSPAATSSEAAGQGGGEGEGIAAAVRVGGQTAGRVRSGVFANRSTTVALGTLIPAVLETAFDSRRPGFARAIVSRDVRGFDGTRVLIPRGSRLTGEYRSDIQPGQKRALINWTRLIRPDGVTMALSSPSADTLGRGGVRGDYNSHFFERFAGAILQSAIQVGVNVASRAAAGNSVIVALPGSTQNGAGSVFESARILPTLTVPAGTSMSVFVARDLDFSAAERRR
jgi:type IV secretion system protein VirB10